MRIMIASDPADLARRGAAMVSQTAQMGVTSRGRFTVALSGGSTPRPMHRLLCEEPYLTAIPWHGTYIFWVDERCVPVDDPASNYGAARADFIDRAPILTDHVHPVPSNLAPEEGAAAYQETLAGFFHTRSSEIPVFDLIILGMGDDGHTASLFPGEDVLSETERLVVRVRGGRPAMDRLTMTFPLLNRARHILFLVSGKAKARMVKAVLEGPPGRFPAQRIQPVQGDLSWLLDRDAAMYLGA